MPPDAIPSVPSALRPFWNACRQAAGSAVDEARFYEAFCFGDSEALANELAALVLAGVKRATAGALWSFEAEGKRLPRPGDLSVVTDWAGTPLCLIETRSVQVMTFNEVPAAFAAAEGEGDASLAGWREAHRAFFTRECEAAGRRFSEHMAVVCECFEVVCSPGTCYAA